MSQLPFLISIGYSRATNIIKLLYIKQQPFQSQLQLMVSLYITSDGDPLGSQF